MAWASRIKRSNCHSGDTCKIRRDSGRVFFWLKPIMLKYPTSFSTNNWLIMTNSKFCLFKPKYCHWVTIRFSAIRPYYVVILEYVCWAFIHRNIYDVSSHDVGEYLGGDFKNKQTKIQLFEQEYNCPNNCLSLKTIIISIKLFHQEYIFLSSIWLINKLFLGKKNKIKI